MPKHPGEESNMDFLHIPNKLCSVQYLRHMTLCVESLTEITIVLLSSPWCSIICNDYMVLPGLDLPAGEQQETSCSTETCKGSARLFKHHPTVFNKESKAGSVVEMQARHSQVNL